MQNSCVRAYVNSSMAPPTALELPATQTLLTSRRHDPSVVQHCAAMICLGMPGHEVVLSCTPGSKHPNDCSLSPRRTRTPPAGMPAEVGGSDGGGDGGGGDKGRGENGGGGGHANDVYTG